MGKLVFQSETKGGGKYTFGNQRVMKSGGMAVGYSLLSRKNWIFLNPSTDTCSLGIFCSQILAAGFDLCVVFTLSIF